MAEEHARDVDCEVDVDDAESILETIGRALLADPGVEASRSWQGFLLLSGFKPGHSAREMYKFDGILTLPCRFSMRNPAVSKELTDPLRRLTSDPERGPWRTWALRYNEQTGEFDHRFLWPGDDDDLNVLANGVDPERVSAMNPVDPSRLPTPFSATGAHKLFANYVRTHDVPKVRIRVDGFWADRLEGGWRVYARADGARDAGPLADISDAVDGLVYLVADNTHVTHTAAAVGEHQRILEELTTWT